MPNLVRTGLVVVAYTALALNAAATLAHAASRPTAYTGEVSQVTYSSATFKGSVYPGNQSTSYYFQYGQTSAYGAQTPVASAGGGPLTIHVSEPATALSAGTAYHYRLVAVNGSGSANGQDRVFSTKTIPLTFGVAAMPGRHIFGTPISVNGSLSGTGSANHGVVLQANSFPYLGGFRSTGNSVLTDARGDFSFPNVSLAENTQLRVATLDTPPTYSAVMVAFVELRVTLHVRSTRRAGYVRLYGTVQPGQMAAIVAFQHLRRRREPVTFDSTPITPGPSGVLRFSRVVHIRHAGLYRAFAYVTDAAQLPNHSHPVLIG